MTSGRRSWIATLASALAPMMVVALLVTGCRSTDDEPVPESTSAPSRLIATLPPEPPGIRMSFLQQRIWEGGRRADLRIINITDSTLLVRRIGIDWAGFPGRLQRHKQRVGPGATLDLHYRLPDPDCTARPDDAANGVAELADRGAGPSRIRRPIDEAGMRFLTRLWSEACARRQVDELLTIDWSVPDPRDPGLLHGDGPGATLDGHLTLRRKAGSEHPEVRAVSLQGTVLFDLTLARPTRGLAAGQGATRVPVTIGAGRCDEHARSQASQPFTFRLALQIADNSTLTSVVVTPSRPDQRRLLTFLDLACAGRTAH